MERWLPTALAALALALSAWNAWSIASLSAQMAAPVMEVEEMTASAGTSGVERPFRGAPERKPRYGDERGPERFFPRDDDGSAEAVSVDDPAFREKVASVMEAEEERRDAERRARFEESIQTEIQAFADEEGLDDATTTALFAQMAERTDAFRSVRDDVRNGTITWSEGRAEMDELRTTGDAEMEKLLGAERAERLQTRLWGERGGGGWGPPR